MLEQLELLLELSKIDSRLQDLLDESASLPQQIDELEAEKERLSADVSEKESRLGETKGERQRFERRLEDLSAKLEDLVSKQLAIKTNEEYAALSHEIEFVKKEMSDTEDVILRQLEALEQANDELAAAREAASSAARDLEERAERMRAELGRLEDAVAIKEDEKLRVSKRVAPVTLRRYERLLESKGDSALARVTSGACSGCYMKLPPQTVIEVKRADRFIECQSCGRILFWQREEEGG